MDESVCYIKPEYLVPRLPQQTSSEKPSTEITKTDDGSPASGTDEPAAKKGRFAERNKKKKNRGQNKNRQLPFKVKDDARLCKTLLDGNSAEQKCENTNCRFSHDLQQFIQLKPKDIGETCYVYSLKGYCNFGVTCRFAGVHLDENLNNKLQEGVEKENCLLVSMGLSSEVQHTLRKKSYNYEKSNAILKKFQTLQWKAKEAAEADAQEKTVEADVQEKATDTDAIADVPITKQSGACTDEDVIKLRSEERKKINFKDKLYLSPLTTVGNLPFRRICKEFGVDITCGEMACSIPIINGVQQEWALTKRHSSEDLFGVQICANNAKLATYAAQVIAEQANADFIDLNLGCPIDLIFRQGAGSALLRRHQILEVLVQSCTRVLADYGKEFTVKTRTGIYANKSVAHELVPKFEEWGASLVTVHGRSKEQRYTRRADYDYVQKCAQQAKTIPIFGNGDILGYRDYLEARERAPALSGIMIGRGALIKPWIFQEIKEQKELDISSSERMDILKRYVNYGLEHWGSDSKGVENTRRFLLEWQSFLYRYVPYGLLERPPQKINQRPEPFKGRDDLETLMASPNCTDWVKLSEMLLGPVPDGFHFVPKHKANAFN